MAMENQTVGGKESSRHTRSGKIERLMTAASAGAIALAAPHVIIAPAHALPQALPSGCTDAVTTDTPNNADGFLDAGETITCLSPPDPIDPISTTVEDLTIIIGDASTPTNVGALALGAPEGVKLESGGTIILQNTASTISGGSAGVYLVSALSGVDDLTISAEGAIESDGSGVFIGNGGSGSIVVNVADVTAVGDGVSASATSASADISIVSAGVITAGGDGVKATNDGMGATTISVNSIAAYGGRGIDVENSSSAMDLTITGAAGSLIYGNRNGIEAVNLGSGNTTINVANVTGEVDDGIFAYHNADGDLSVTASGTVTAADDGVYARNLGAGSTTISVVNVTAYDGYGIYATNTSSGTDITITGAAGGLIYGYDYGVYVINSGSGTTTINVANVTGKVDDGIYVDHAGGDLSVTASGTVTADENGLQISNRGNSSTTLTVHSVTAYSLDGIYVVNAANTTDLTIIGSAGGLIDGNEDGIDAANLGTGATTISVNTVDADAVGVYVNAAASTTGEVSVTATGVITAGQRGIDIDQDGTGAVTVVVDSVTSTARDAVYISTTSATTGDVAITANGDLISSGDDGVEVDHGGSGALTIRVADVTSNGSDGDHAIDIDTDGGDLTIVSAGTLSAYSDGVSIIHDGTGNADLRLNNITTVDGDGVDLVTTSGSATVDLSVEATGLIDAGEHGVSTNHRGTGGTTIEVNDIIAVSDGVRAQNGVATTGDLSVTATGAITAGFDGVQVDQYGTGAATISVNGVTANDGAGIDVYSASTAGLVSITATGSIAAYGAATGKYGVGVYAEIEGAGISIDAADVYGERFGVYVDNTGSGPIAISADNVTGGTRDGVRVSDTGASSVAVTATGLVSGAYSGVYIVSDSAVIMNVNDATGDSRYGVHVQRGAAATGDISVTSTGDISGFDAGINVRNIGAGDVAVAATNVTATSGVGINVFGRYLIDVSATGLVSATNSRGIFVENVGSGNGAVTINAASISAGSEGVYVRQYSDGGVSVTTSGAVTAASAGIDVKNYGDGDVVINAEGTVNADGYGVSVLNYGAGATVVEVAAVTAGAAAGDIGVGAYNVGTDLTITATGAVTAGGEGIGAANRGTGALVVNAADVTGGVSGSGAGIIASNFGTDLTINATGSVTGQSGGVFVNNFGTGDTTVNVVDVVSSGFTTGLLAANSGGDLTIVSTGVIETGFTAVSAINSGSGTASVTVVDAIGGVGDGVEVTNSVLGTDVFITATGSVSGDTGVGAVNSGTGVTSINVAQVSGGAYGVRAINSGTDLTITATGLIEADRLGVWTLDNGSGDAAINVADVTGAGEDGIWARKTDGGRLSITATGTVSGGEEGIYAYHLGNGDVSVTANNVYALAGGDDAIEVYNSAAGGALSITASGVVTSAYDDGVDVVNHGGDLAVLLTETVSAGDKGITAENIGAGAVSIVANNVYALAGGGDAIEVYNSSAGGALSVTTTGMVTSADGVGIEVFNFGAGDATINLASAVVGETEDGVFVLNEGGALTVMSSGTVSGGRQGVTAVNLGDGEVTIVANNVYALAGGDDAIEVFNSSAGGALSVTTTGTVTSADDDGIDVRNSGTDLVISTSGGAVTGYQSGIEAYNYGSGATTITVANAVTGETEIGVFAVSVNGTDITIEEDGSITGDVAAIWLDGAAGPGEPADDVLTLNSGGSISGDALLLAGDDVFNDASGQFTTVFGGDGIDTANFASGGARTIDGSGGADDSLQEFEVFNFNAGGFTLAGEHEGLSETNFNAGTNTLTGVLTSAQTTIAAGAGLNAADGSAFNGDLNVNGTLNIGNSPGATIVDGDVTFGATSVLPIEVEGDASDLLIATGDVALGGELQVLLLGGVSVGTTTRTIIDAGTGVTGSFADITGQTGLLISNSVDIDSSTFDVALTTTINPASSVDGLNGNEASIGDYLIDVFEGTSLDADLVELVNALGVISDVNQLRSALGELHPEGFDGGLRFLANSQSRFTANVLSGPGYAARSAGASGAHVWAAVDVSGLSGDGRAQNQGFDGEGYEFSLGVSGIEKGPLSFGIAAGYASFSGETNTGLSDDIDTSLFRAGASARLMLDGQGPNGHIDGAFSYAAGDNELTMTLIDPASGAVAVQAGKADINSIGFAARYTLTGFNGRSWPVRPHAEAGVDRIHQDAVNVGTEQTTALAVEDLNSTRTHLALGASFDRQIAKALSFKASVTGMRYFGDTANSFTSRFAAAPDDAASFRTNGVDVEWLARMQAGVSYEHESGFTLSADAFGDVGDVNAYGARIKLLRPF